MNRRLIALPAAVLAMSMVASCSSSADSPKTASKPDRKAVVTELVDKVIVPANERAASTAKALSTAVDALCASPTAANHAAADAALSTGFAAWKYVDSFDIGPAMKRRSASVMSYAVDPQKVDTSLASTPPTDALTVRNRTSSSLRGYGAATYLLAGDPAAPDDPAAFAGPRCAYLSAVVDVLVDETSIISTAWTDGVDGTPAYRETATGEGAGALSSTAVIDALVNMQVNQLEATAKQLTASAEADPEQPADLTPYDLFQVAAQVTGMQAVYGPLGSLLDAELAAEVRAGLDKITAVLAETSKAPVAGQPTPSLVKDLESAVTDLHLTIGTDVVSALDVTISFSDNDGDS